MIHIMDNGELVVTVSDTGAEIVSIKYDGCEYLWQGDPQFWAEHAPFMFPICGRLFESRYIYNGKMYEMDLHGFARHMEFEPLLLENTRAQFRLLSTNETKSQYPFDFELVIEYELDKKQLKIRATIKNKGNDVLPATFGAHPGFNVPLDCGDFSKWYLEFAEECSPDRILMSKRYLNTGKKSAMPLENGRILRLKHSMFEDGGIFMSRMASAVTLKSSESKRSVRLNYPDFPYLGVWHKMFTDAPYVCIEPWCGLPAYDGEYDDLKFKNDMFRIYPNSQRSISLEMKFE